MAAHPGPQDYCPPAPSKGPSFSIAARLPHDVAAEASDGPGVGEYTPPEPPKGPAYSIAGRPAASAAMDGAELPGPSDYTPKVLYQLQARNHLRLRGHQGPHSMWREYVPFMLFETPAAVQHTAAVCVLRGARFAANS